MLFYQLMAYSCLLNLNLLLSAPLPTLKPTYPGTNTHRDIGSANVSFGTYNTLLNFSVFLLFFLFLVLRE